MKALIVTLTLIGSLTLLGTLPAQVKVLTKQEQATRAFESLTGRMQKLRVTLKSTDPEKAKIIGLGAKFIEETALTSAMKDIETLLAEESWDDAIEKCQRVIKDLNTLINLLLKGDTRIEDILKEIQRLEKFKDKVEDLIEQEKAEKDDSARAEALEHHLKNLEKAKRDLDDLIKDQKDLRGEANKSGLATDPDKATEMSNKESGLKDRAEKVSEDLKEIEQETRDLDADAKEPGDGKPGDGKPGKAGKSSKAASGASQDMGKAAGKLQDNKPESSLEDMDKAIEKLEAAKKEIEDKIEEAKRELLKLPFEQLNRKQEQTKIETDKLAEEMEKSESEPGEGQGKPTPGKQNVQQSVPKMKSAAGSLKEYKPGKAKQDQQDAQDKLEEAKKKLEDALAQLRQQLQDEVLRSLEERFGAMLARQKKISASTRLIHAQKKESLTANGGISSALKKRTGLQSTGEFELASEAHGSLKLLEEDGTTAVFPDFVIEVRDDLKTVGKRLTGDKTGKATQAMQKEIEDMLEMLIDALRQQIEQNESNGGEP